MKYKCGDEVLLRGRVKDIDDSHGTIEFASCDSGRFMWVHESEVYSLAPEFGYLEEIEVRDGEADCWRIKRFLAKNPHATLRFVVQEKLGASSWAQARKIQPKEESPLQPEINAMAEAVYKNTIVEINGTKYKLQKVEG